MDTNRGQFTDCTYCNQGQIFFLGQFFRTEVGCPETKTDPVILVSRVYHCFKDHQLLSHDTVMSQHDLFHYIMSHIHARLRHIDSECLLGQMYYDIFSSDLSGSSTLHSALQGTFNNRNAETNQCQIQPPGRRVITNCFFRCYFEQEHVYSQCMSELRCIWLSADHTFKVSPNIGAWCQGVWVKQFDSLFTVLNEKGQVLAWRLTRGRAFHKVKNALQNLKGRLDNNGISTTSIYINNCRQWRNSLQNVVGDNVWIKLDLFHAFQRVVSKIPKQRAKGFMIKGLCHCLKEEPKLIFVILQT